MSLVLFSKNVSRIYISKIEFLPECIFWVRMFPTLKAYCLIVALLRVFWQITFMRWIGIWLIISLEAMIIM